MDVKLTECEREQIHIPGLIQPFGVLFSLAGEDLVVLQVSQNIQEILGINAENIIEKPLSLFLSRESPKLPSPTESFDRNPYRLYFRGKKEKKEFLGWFHFQNQRLILEIEPSEKSGLLESWFHREIDFLSAIQGASSVVELCQIAVDEVRKVSGYDRVMVYRFDSDWNGKVIVESKHERLLESYLGHHFPASDIPAQARAVFLQNWIRMIPDVAYHPDPLVPKLDPKTNAPLDLGKSFLRSVSPIHIQYLKNMNVGGTMTLSIVSEGKLWGLVACHHQKSHLLTYEKRTVCEFIGRLISSHLAMQAIREDLEYKTKLKKIFTQLLEHMAREEDLAQGLIQYSPNVLDLVGAQGAAAAIHFEGSWRLIGMTPTEDQIDQLVHWLNESGYNDGVFHTDQLSSLYPQALSFKDRASGLLSISIPKTERSFILWFRPEVIQSVTWAGNPKKEVEALSDGSVKIEPRASFESWKEELKNRSLPWRSVEIETAMELRHALLGLDLNRQFKREQKARAQAEKMSREKEDLVATVSHDLKNPLAAIRLTLQMLERKTQKHREKNHFEEIIQEMTSASQKIDKMVHRMERLIHDLLDIAKIEGGRFVIDQKAQEVLPLISEVVTLLFPIAQTKKISLRVEISKEPCVALFDEDRLLQVLSNLVGNAIKFTPEHGDVLISVETQSSQIIVKIKDTGPGVPPDQLSHVFDRFWQATRTQRMGTGLGLAISKGIIEAHGGKIWMESEVGKGSCVTFTLKACNGSG